MKSSIHRSSNPERPQVRAANLALTQGDSASQYQEFSNSVRNDGMFTEEPYHDLLGEEGSGAPVEEEPFDYSLLGRPNNSAVMPRKRSVQHSPSRPRSSQSSQHRNTQRSSSRQAAPSRSKKKQSGGGVRVLAAVVAVIAIVAGVVGILFATGFFKPRIEVTMADGTVKKIKAESAFAELTEGNRFYDGTLVNDINIGGMTKEEAFAAISKGLEAAPLNVNIDLKVRDTVYDLDMSSLTLTVNTDDVLNEAFALNRPTNPDDFEELTRCYNEYQKMKNNPAVFHTAYTCSTDGLSELVHGVLDPLETAPQNAVITDFDKTNNKFIVQPETVGFHVETDKAVEDVTALLVERIYEGVVDVSGSEIEPEVTQAFIDANFGKISSCSSKTTNSKSRNANINQACEYIDGVILNPGEEFSYNEHVGMTTAERGFQEATVIIRGQYAQGLGGGICQVSTMLYGAAVKANMEITSRRAHAWPSNYVDVGLDATVDYGSIDFKFRNTSDYQIVIRAQYNSSDNGLVVSIYGHKLPEGQRIDFISSVNSTTPHGDTEYVANPDLAVGEKNTVRNAHDGINVTSYKVWYDADGNEIKREEVATTNYRMYNKKVEVGTKLPNGGHANFDPKTGKVITPSPAPTKAPTPVPVITTEPPAPSTEDGGGE